MKYRSLHRSVNRYVYKAKWGLQRTPFQLTDASAPLNLALQEGFRCTALRSNTEFLHYELLVIVSATHLWSVFMDCLHQLHSVVTISCLADYRRHGRPTTSHASERVSRRMVEREFRTHQDVLMNDGALRITLGTPAATYPQLHLSGDKMIRIYTKDETPWRTLLEKHRIPSEHPRRLLIVPEAVLLSKRRFVPRFLSLTQSLRLATTVHR